MSLIRGERSIYFPSSDSTEAQSIRGTKFAAQEKTYPALPHFYAFYGPMPAGMYAYNQPMPLQMGYQGYLSKEGSKK